MVNLTFGEQVKIILSRKGMTIKELAEQVEQHTGKPMSRQNMTQRLGRDNFQEQDMRLIAKILGCKFTLSIMEMEEASESEVFTGMVSRQEASEMVSEAVRDITLGELVDMVDEDSVIEEIALEDVLEVAAVEAESNAVEETPVKPQVDEREREILRKGISGYFKKGGMKKEAGISEEGASKDVSQKQEPILGEINPYTGKEYKTNSVRMHPKRIGYVQVYDAEQHKWTEMTEWAFLGYQERKKMLMGKDYVPPIYLD